jgi:hypothetical protein
LSLASRSKVTHVFPPRRWAASYSFSRQPCPFKPPLDPLPFLSTVSPPPLSYLCHYPRRRVETIANYGCHLTLGCDTYKRIVCPLQVHGPSLPAYVNQCTGKCIHLCPLPESLLIANHSILESDCWRLFSSALFCFVLFLYFFF